MGTSAATLQGCERIFVTGADGFVGRHLLTALRIAAPDALVVCGGRGPDADVIMDLRVPDSVGVAIAEARPDLVFHLAGEASVASADIASAETWRVNLVGTLALAESLGRTNPAATLLFSSSSEVYGRAFADHGKLTEDRCPLPVSVYAHSKLATEAMLATVLPARTTLICARPSNHVGPGQGLRFALPSFAAQLAESEMAGRWATIRVGNLGAERDFLDVRDVVSAYLLLAARLRGSAAREVVNVASGNPVTIGTLLDKMRALATMPSEVIVDRDRFRPAEVRCATVDATKLRQMTGWTPHYDLGQSVQAVLDDWRAQRAGSGALGGPPAST